VFDPFDCGPFDRVYPELAAVLSAAKGATEEVVEWAQGMTKKSPFLVIFLLTIFDNMLKWSYVCQQANINRQ